ncbi:unnamed protein product [Symbiodinium sp. KB8]|nr:unnamed protein product [Symbiodinium sp. KB8]
MFKPTCRQFARHGLGVNTDLDEAWKERCVLTEHVRAPALDSSHAFRASTCCQLCFCVHQGEGLKAFRMHTNIVQLLKPHIQAIRRKRKNVGEMQPAEAKKSKPQHPEARRLLDRAMLVLRLHAATADRTATSENAADAAGSGASTSWNMAAQRILALADETELLGPTQEFWLHIGYMNHNSKVFTALPLDKDAACGVHADMVKLVASDQNVRAYRLFEFLKDHIDFEQVNFNLHSFMRAAILKCLRWFAGMVGRAKKASMRAGVAAVAPAQEVVQGVEVPLLVALLGVLVKLIMEEDWPPSDASVADAEGIEQAGPDAVPIFPGLDAAASSSDARVPGPDVHEAEAVPPAARATGGRAGGGGRSGEEIIRLDVTGGRLVYYAESQDLKVFCTNAGHLNCEKKRTVKPGGRKGQGRPIGFLLAWLACADSFEDARKHVHNCKPTLAQRKEARENFKTVSGWQALADKERERRVEEGEPEEPPLFTIYVMFLRKDLYTYEDALQIDGLVKAVHGQEIQDVLGRQTECEALPIERLLFDEKDSRLAQDLVDMEKAGLSCWVTCMNDWVSLGLDNLFLTPDLHHQTARDGGKGKAFELPRQAASRTEEDPEWT